MRPDQVVAVVLFTFFLALFVYCEFTGPKGPKGPTAA